jgi:hypothetical protein
MALPAGGWVVGVMVVVGVVVVVGVGVAAVVTMPVRRQRRLV